MLVDRKKAGPASPLAALEFGWSVLSGLGMVFFVVGGLDVVLAWYPLGFGSPAWEFGTVSLSLNGLPLPVLGLGMGLASGVALSRRWQVRLVAVTMTAIAVLVMMSSIVWATNVPMAMESTADPLGKLGVERSIIKSIAQIVCYPVVLIWLAVSSWKLADMTADVPPPVEGVDF